ncbi:MAG: 1-hydroxycarotenoid 3,4-desaturase CrtD [Crocinitomicaceae bacterium]
MKQSKKAIVIGAGVAGLASAIRLKLKGFEVNVYEAQPQPGGKLNRIKIGGYSFDTGPSLFTMPHFIEELFDLAGKDISNYFSYLKSDIACHYFFEDGTRFNFYTDANRRKKEFKNVFSDDVENIERYLTKSAYIFEKTKKTFLEKSLHKINTYLNKDILSTIFAIPNLGLFTTLHRRNKKSFKNKKLVQVFDRYATYNGSNPYKTPGIMSLIPHLENGIGTFLPKNGMFDIVQALYSLAKDIGVVFHFNQKVERVIVEKNTISGIVLSGFRIEADLVFCNVDIKIAYQKLLKDVRIPKSVLSQEPSSSALIFYWGIKKEFKELGLHNIFFSNDYKKEFELIFKKGEVIDDPTVYINITKKFVDNDAQEGCENWFVMVNVPYDSGQDWGIIRKELRKNILIKLSRILKVDVERLIEEEEYLDPLRIEEKTSSYAGALYGSSSNSQTAAFFRNPNFSKIKGLYFVGGSVHPGGGIPLCLLSAKIATSIVK